MAHPQDNYSYAFASPGPRYSSSHSSSSAMSPSANPDEDWTKISDLAERRRIQNRIAQRNYRKKLKRRLEDLERRAGSSSVSPEPSHAELVPMSQSRHREEDTPRKRSSKNDVPPTAQRRPQASTYPQPTSMKEDHAGMFARQYTRQLSASPPPTFTYSYPVPEPPQIHAPYPQHASFHSLPAPYPTEYSAQSLYLPPLPVTLPSMSSYDSASTKTDSPFTDDDMLHQFNMSYASMSGIEIPTTQSYADSNAYTPPLSLSHSFEHSRTGSPCDSSMMCPGTPMSIPTSPHFMMN